MSQALQVLRKLRQFEMEIEEMKLQEKHRLERSQREHHERAKDAIIQAVQIKDSLGFGSLRLHMDSYLREASAAESMSLRQLQIAEKDRQLQTNATLQAKQRRDMMDRILERKRQEILIEQDHKERKALDDVAQSLQHHKPSRGEQ